MLIRRNIYPRRRRYGSHVAIGDDTHPDYWYVNVASKGLGSATQNAKICVRGPRDTGHLSMTTHSIRGKYDS